MNLFRILITPIVAIYFGVFSDIVVADDNNNTVNIVHPIDHTVYPHSDPQPLRSYMQTFSFGATCRFGGELHYYLKGSAGSPIFEEKYVFFGHTSFQFGYELRPGDYTFIVETNGNECKKSTDVSFSING